MKAKMLIAVLGLLIAGGSAFAQQARPRGPRGPGALAVDVILLKDVDKVGLRGDVVSVARGYARNFLRPRGLAEDVSGGKMKQVEAERRRAVEKLDRLEQEARELGERISQYFFCYATPFECFR